MFPFPSPSPVIQDVVVNPVIHMSSPSWGSPTVWAPVLASLVVSLVTLLGVLKSSQSTGNNMIAAEALRATAALEAEERRHSNALDQRTKEWHRENKTQNYAEILASFEILLNSMNKALWSRTPLGDGSGGMVDEGVFCSERLRIEGESATLLQGLARVRLFGGAEIAEQGRRLGLKYISMYSEALEIAHNTPADYDFEALMRKLQNKNRKRRRRVTSLMREDLLGEEFGDLVSKKRARDDGASADSPKPGLKSPDPCLVVPAVVHLPLDDVSDVVPGLSHESVDGVEGDQDRLPLASATS